MNTLAIFGVDTVAGANLARSFSADYRVIGICDHNAPELPGCQLISGDGACSSPGQLLADLQPQRVIDASCVGDSPWNPQASIGSEEQCERSAELAASCKEKNIPYVLLSSDAVLSGPWMFHEEDSECRCSSIISQRLLNLERAVLQNEQALVVRTHVFGWSQTSGQTGWVENLLERMQQGQTCADLQKPGHATPIVASELAQILNRAFSESLTGLYHVAGAERVNRIQFARRLAQSFDVSWFGAAASAEHFTEAERKSFGFGETSLQTRMVRRELCVAMPTLTESMQQLREQQDIASISLSRRPLSRAA
ncbi:sugar nucleotide-binding protein [Rubinisphaera margarita]|uniref:sugar nucleotide-binding protein n=1 Tax=Rubinisphaera margarita TaxID=2909586 RepID=UPI001EE9345B|nr:sugar nucleotide-binding protein [Rubinisphaera margarita]MCG6154458.1 sugar nucleotide-binding protein [Rubinisphaera margarita]